MSSGKPTEELGGSEYFAQLGTTGNTVPALDAATVISRYWRLTDAISRELVASAYPVGHGGLGIALAKTAIAGRLGMDITIPGELRPDYYLFSESTGRFVVTIAPHHKRAFELIVGQDAILLGRVGGRNLRITSHTLLLDLPVDELEAAYKAPFRGTDMTVSRRIDKTYGHGEGSDRPGNDCGKSPDHERLWDQFRDGDAGGACPCGDDFRHRSYQ